MGKRTKKRNDKYNFFFRIDKKRVKSLSNEERVHYFEGLVSRILAAPVFLPIVVTVGDKTYEVSRKDAIVFLEAYRQLLTSRVDWEAEQGTISYRVKEFAGSLVFKKNQEKASDILSPNYKLVRTSISAVMSTIMVANIVAVGVSGEKVKMPDREARAYEFSNSQEYAAKEGSEDGIVASLAMDVAEKVDLNLRAIEAERLAQEAIRAAEERRQDAFDNYLEEYCMYFNLDSAKVIEIARTLTDNYTNPFDDIIGSDIFKPKNDEAACLIFVRRLMKNQLTVKLSEFGLTSNDLVISNEVYGTGREKGELLVLRNGMTGTQFLGRICDLLGMDKYYCLSISYLEAGKGFSSNLCRNKNNFGGMRANGEFFTYPSPEAGIIVFCINLKNYEKYELTNIYDLSGIYVNGNRSNPSPTWVNNVLGYHKMFIEHSDEFFLPKETVEPESLEVVEQENTDYAMVMKPVSQK